MAPASIVVFLAFIGHLAWQSYSLIVDEAQPGSTPFPSLQANKLPAPGGWFPVDLSDPLQYELLTHLVEIAIDIKQGQESASNKKYVFRKLIRISSASKQIVRSTNYDVVFYVGERSCIRYPIQPPFARGLAHDRDNSTTVISESGPSGGGNASARLILLPPRRYYHGCTINYNGQFGKCFFRINTQSKPYTLDVTKAKCEKTSRQDAYGGD